MSELVSSSWVQQTQNILLRNCFKNKFALLVFLAPPLLIGQKGEELKNLDFPHSPFIVHHEGPLGDVLPLC